MVSDPQNEEGDCADVAYASVDFLQVSNEPGKQPSASADNTDTRV